MPPAWQSAPVIGPQNTQAPVNPSSGVTVQPYGDIPQSARIAREAAERAAAAEADRRRQAAADASSAGSGAQVDQATIDANIRLARANADRAEAEARMAAQNAAQGPAPQARQTAVSPNATGALELLRIIDGQGGIQSIYNNSFEDNGILSIGEYSFGGLNQSEGNTNLAAQNAMALPLIKRFMRVSGEGANSDRDQAAYRALLPDPNARDAGNQLRISNMRNAALAILRSDGYDVAGYNPSDPQSRADAWANHAVWGTPASNPIDAPLPNALERPYNTAPTVRETPTDTHVAGAGDASLVETNPEMQARHTQWIAQHRDATAEQYADFAYELYHQYGGQQPRDAFLQYGRSLEEYNRAGRGGEINTTIVTEQPMTSDQQASAMGNNPIVNGLRAGAAEAANLGSFGVGDLAFPEQMAALRNDHPVSTAIGGVAGAVAGTGLLSRAGMAAAERIPSIGQRLLNGGGAWGQFGRNLATDASYGGIYGQMSEGDAGTGALQGGMGSIYGQAAGRLGGALLRGVVPREAAGELLARNVPLSAGQQLGPTASRWEERLADVPILGDLIRNRRAEGIQGLNQAAFQEAGDTVGRPVTQTGQNGLAQLEGLRSDAYNNVQFQNGPIPLDDPFMAGIANASSTVPNAPARQRLAGVLDAHLRPLIDNGSMSADDFIRARRGLSAARSQVPEQFTGFDGLYRNAITGARNNLDELVTRAGDPQAIEALNTANTLNRQYQTLRDATRRAERGGPTGEPYEFGPGMLQAASQASARNYPGPAPFGNLAENAVRVMSDRVPNSGSAGRIAALTAGTALLGGGAGYGLSGEDSGAEGAGIGTAGGIAALMLASLAGTKAGQRGLVSALTRRPQIMRNAGLGLERRSGIIGRALLPFAIQQPEQQPAPVPIGY